MISLFAKEDIRQLVMARIRTMPQNIRVAIGMKSYTKEELLKNVEDDTEIGREVIRIDMQYLRDVASGEIYKEE